MNPRFRAAFGALLAAALLAPQLGQVCVVAASLCRCGHFHGEICCCLKAEAGHCDTPAPDAGAFEAAFDDPAEHLAVLWVDGAGEGEAEGVPEGEGCRLRRDGRDPVNPSIFADYRHLPAILRAPGALAAARSSEPLGGLAPALHQPPDRAPERPPPRLDLPA